MKFAVGAALLVAASLVQESSAVVAVANDGSRRGRQSSGAGDPVAAHQGAGSSKAALVRRQPSDFPPANLVHLSDHSSMAGQVIARFTPTEELERLRVKDKLVAVQSFVQHFDGLCASGFSEASATTATSLAHCSRVCWSKTRCQFFGFNALTSECIPHVTEKCEQDTTQSFPLFTTYEAKWTLTHNSANVTAPRCDYSQEACRYALESQGLQVGGGGYNFVAEYKTSGCFYYFGGPLATIGFYGTTKGGGDLSDKVQLTRLDTSHQELARPIGYPACHQTGDSSPGCLRLGAITQDLADHNVGCEVSGGEWVNLTDSMNLTNFDHTYESNWDSMTASWTQTDANSYMSVVRAGHQPDCERVCRLQVYQHGRLCCYFNPASNLGCFVKPQANVSVQGSGKSAMCDFGMGYTE